MLSINPATGRSIRNYETHPPEEVERSVAAAASAFRTWRESPFAIRTGRMRRAAGILRADRARFAAVITAEMGKPIVEAEAEVEKCAWCCDYYAENAEAFLRIGPRDSSATESYVQYPPLGVILAVMPWNFPFWQVFRFAAPALMAGNTGILKHASNVPGCAVAIEEILREAGFEDGQFRSLLIPGSQVAGLVSDPRIAAVTLTGSEPAGSQVAAQAGKELKKSVLELGGSDPFVVLADADIELAARTAVRARFLNSGQSCIAAKRFIVVDEVYDRFEAVFVEGVRALKTGDPLDRATQVGPMARADLIDDLERQVRESVARGARVLIGGRRIQGPGWFFEPTVLAGVTAAMPAACEETFGPVAALIRAKDTAEAIRIANATTFGLGASLWTTDIPLARTLSRDIEAGQVFVNGMVASDPRLPFGGVKRSGYGRELSELGIREFVNIQTVWIGPARQ